MHDIACLQPALARAFTVFNVQSISSRAVFQNRAPQATAVPEPHLAVDTDQIHHRRAHLRRRFSSLSEEGGSGRVL